MKHLLGYIEGSVIEYISDLQEKMDKVATDCDFTVVSCAFHQFDPVCVTGVLVLAESHFSAHTYPENGKVYLDVFCCSPHFDPWKCAASIEHHFGSEKSNWTVQNR
jgi:S-adenosylmethionine decarboxylase proenzyme